MDIAVRRPIFSEEERNSLHSYDKVIVADSIDELKLQAADAGALLLRGGLRIKLGPKTFEVKSA